MVDGQSLEQVASSSKKARTGTNAAIGVALSGCVSW